MKKSIFLGALAAVLCGCATLDNHVNMDWIPIGPDFPANKTQKVEVVSGRDQITRPYGNLGLLRIKNVDPDRDSLRRGIERGKKFVASKGADAMFLGQYNSAEDGASVPKVTLIIYAIKYVDNLTPQDQKAIEDFEVLGILNERTNS